MAYETADRIYTKDPNIGSWSNKLRGNQEDHEGRIGTDTADLSTNSSSLSNHESRITTMEGAGSTTGMVGHTQGAYALTTGVPVGGTIINWTWPASAHYLRIHASEHDQATGRGDADGFWNISLGWNLMFGAGDYATHSAYFYSANGTYVRNYALYNAWPTGAWLTAAFRLHISVYTPGSRNIQIAYSITPEWNPYGSKTTLPGYVTMNFSGCCTILAYS